MYYFQCYHVLGEAATADDQVRRTQLQPCDTDVPAIEPDCRPESRRQDHETVPAGERHRGLSIHSRHRVLTKGKALLQPSKAARMPGLLHRRPARGGNRGHVDMSRQGILAKFWSQGEENGERQMKNGVYTPL